MSLEVRSMRKMSSELKLAAESGVMEKYLPWYGAAGLGAVGHEIGKRIVPKKFKALGAIGGTLLGTGLGVHGGEAVGKKLDQRQRNLAAIRDLRQRSRADPELLGNPNWKEDPWYLKERERQGKPDMSIQPVPGPKPPMKLAAAEKKKPSAARVLGSSLLGMGAGMGAGYGAAKGLDALSRAAGGKGMVPSTAAKAMPFVGGALGMTAPLLHYATLQNMREEHLKKQEQQRGS